MRLLIFPFYDEKLMHENMLKYNVIQYCICAEHVQNKNSSTFRSHNSPIFFFYNSYNSTMILKQYKFIKGKKYKHKYSVSMIDCNFL